MRVAPAVEIPPEDHRLLLKWSRSKTAPQRLVERSRIVLMAGDGLQNKQICEELGLVQDTVRKWRRRYIEQGLPGIQSDAPRSGRPPLHGPDVEAAVLELTPLAPPGSTHWSAARLAKRLGLARTTVQAIWNRHDLKPHLVRTFKLSNDPLFEEKVHDVVGLYLDPPDNALVISVDEKTQVQALDRTRPRLAVRKGLPAHQTHDYKRNGRTDLFAALVLQTGEVIHEFQEKHRHQEFIQFLEKIDASTESGLDLHLIVDNAGTHTTPEVMAWLKEHPRFHVHLTPTGSSWMNMVERIFSSMTLQCIRRGSFDSLQALKDAIDAWVTEHNRKPTVYRWRKTADEIIRKVEKWRRIYRLLH